MIMTRTLSPWFPEASLIPKLRKPRAAKVKVIVIKITLFQFFSAN